MRVVRFLPEINYILEFCDVLGCDGLRNVMRNVIEGDNYLLDATDSPYTGRILGSSCDACDAKDLNVLLVVRGKGWLHRNPHGGACVLRCWYRNKETFRVGVPIVRARKRPHTSKNPWSGESLRKGMATSASGSFA